METESVGGKKRTLAIEVGEGRAAAEKPVELRRVLDAVTLAKMWEIKGQILCYCTPVQLYCNRTGILLVLMTLYILHCYKIILTFKKTFLVTVVPLVFA